MKKIIITGHTSTIAQKLITKIKEKDPQIKIIKVGRSADSDVKINFFVLSDMKKFTTFLENEKANYLFLNHGILHGKKLQQMSETEIKETLHCNMLSYLMTMESLPKLSDLKTVLMSSISSKAGSYATLYAASKSGMDVMIQSIVKELPASSRLNAVSPGIIQDTKMTEARTDLHILDQKTNATPSKKLTQASDVANTVFYLLFENDNINGENININGGIYCG